MDYETAKTKCHMRSAIYRKANPGVRYWKDHPIPLDSRVPHTDQRQSDWAEYDPRENHFEAYA